jgi:hypothetical protein
MSGVRVGVRVIRNQLPQLAQEFRPNVARAINNGVDNYIDASSQIIPRDTGAMAGNLDIQYASPGDLEGSVGYIEDYSAYVHEGTIFQPPRPWASTIVDAMASEYVASIRAAALGGA